MSNLRDMFTEKPNLKSAFDKENMKKYTNIVDDGLYDCFYSPVQFVDVDYFRVLHEIEKQAKLGKDHILFKNYQKLYARSLSDNIVVPYLDLVNLKLRDLVIISNENDCERIARKHVKKMPPSKVAETLKWVLDQPQDLQIFELAVWHQNTKPDK